MKSLGTYALAGDPIFKQRSPYEVWLMAFAAINGFLLLFGTPVSGSVEAALPPMIVLLWGFCLGVGSLLTLIGLGWPGLIYTSLVIERSGVILASAASIAYSVVILWPTNTEITNAFYAAGITASFGIAGFWRVWQIWRRFRWHRRFVLAGSAALNTEELPPPYDWKK